MKLALPPLRVPVPSVVVPSLNVTVPVGVPAPRALALTAAVKVTLWPNTEGLAEEETLVAVAFRVDDLGQSAIVAAAAAPASSPGKRGRDGMAAHCEAG